VAKRAKRNHRKAAEGTRGNRRKTARAPRNQRNAAEGTARNKPRKKMKPIPDNYPAVNAALRVKGAAEAIRYYKRVFNAKDTTNESSTRSCVCASILQMAGSVTPN